MDSLFRGQTVADFCLSSGGSEIRWNSCSTRRNSTREAVATASSRGKTRLKRGNSRKIAPAHSLGGPGGFRTPNLCYVGLAVHIFPTTAVCGAMFVINSATLQNQQNKWLQRTGGCASFVSWILDSRLGKGQLSRLFLLPYASLCGWTLIHLRVNHLRVPTSKRMYALF